MEINCKGSLNLKKIDFVAAGLTYTSERAKRVLFSKPYVSGDSLVIVSHIDQKLESLNELSGKEITTTRRAGEKSGAFHRDVGRYYF